MIRAAADKASTRTLVPRVNRVVPTSSSKATETRVIKMAAAKASRRASAGAVPEAQAAKVAKEASEPRVTKAVEEAAAAERQVARSIPEKCQTRTSVVQAPLRFLK